MKSRIQVDKTHYKFGRYVDEKRWSSYYMQINETILANPRKILIIGIGDNIVGTVLKSVGGYDVTTFDFDPNLRPDIVGDITEIDEIIKPNLFDCIVCCEVLEHLPGMYFEDILSRIANLNPKTFILSLPNNSCTVRYDIRLFIKGIIDKHFRKINYNAVNENFKFRGEHYWEIGVKGYEMCSINDKLKKCFKLKRQYFVENNEYHSFFILKRK